MTQQEYELVIEFGMWLTTRDKVIKVGAAETVYDMNDALTEFIAMKGYSHSEGHSSFADYTPPPRQR